MGSDRYNFILLFGSSKILIVSQYKALIVILFYKKNESGQAYEQSFTTLHAKIFSENVSLSIEVISQTSHLFPKFVKSHKIPSFQTWLQGSKGSVD